jgi:hypothetical protein
MPVGTRTLDFGPNAFKNLQKYNNPDGINAILAWTSVPVTDANNQLGSSNPPTLIGSTHYRDFARISISNAIAAIEGYEAVNYLLKHHDFPLIDENHNGIITAQEIQDFVDNANATGQPEAGAMAALLGGTARIPETGSTLFGEQPDQPDVLQRRFNFFDYAADGQLNGGITLQQFRMLAHTLLPTPDAFTITDRQRASANGFLLDPGAHRNFTDLQHLLPSSMFVPRSALLKYRNITPDRFGVNTLVPGVDSILSQGPSFALFSGDSVNRVTTTDPSTSSTNSGDTTATAPTTTDSTTTTTNTPAPSTDATTNGLMITTDNTPPAASLPAQSAATPTPVTTTSTDSTDGDTQNQSSIAQAIVNAIQNANSQTPNKNT